MVGLHSRAFGRLLVFFIALLLYAVSLTDFASAQNANIAASGPGASAESSNLTPEQAKALAGLLADERARDAIVAELERIAASGGPMPHEGSAGTPSQAAEPPAQTSLVRSIAEATQQAAETVASRAIIFFDQLARAPQALSAVGELDPDIIVQALTDLLLVMAGTISLFLFLRWAARHLYRRMGAAAIRAGSVGTMLIIGASVLIDAAVVLLSWAGGYLLALVAFGELAEIGIRQSLYLNAFLIVEMVKVAMRAILSPTTSALRPVVLPDRGARVLSRWLNIAVSLVGYGHLLIVPILQQNVSFASARAIATVLSLAAIAILITMTLFSRRQVANWFLSWRRAEDRSSVWLFLARNWHVPVLLYFFSLFAIVLARPGGILVPMLIMSGQVLAAIIVGTIAGNILRRAMSRGVHLPESVTHRLPLLERRLNAFVPKVLGVIRMLIVVAVVGVALQVVGLVDLEAWLNSQFGARITGMFLTVALILIVAFGLWIALSSWIDYRLNPEYGSVPTSREQTLLTLLRNAATIVLLVITLMFVLSELGIDIAPLIASAGVLGLAIGFGAQSLVQDIITGVFIQFENAINVGDIITVGGTTGTVERLTIRSVSLRDVNGVFHIIPFSSVDMVSNYMRGFAYYLCDMGIAYRENVDDAKQAMLDSFTELRRNPAVAADILEDLQWMGLQAFGDSAIILRARIKCLPGKQFAVGRAYNEVLKRVFDERGIEIPFPHQTIYFGEDRQGHAPPLRVLSAGQRKNDTNADDKIGEQSAVESSSSQIAN